MSAVAQPVVLAPAEATQQTVPSAAAGGLHVFFVKEKNGETRGEN